MRQLIKRCEAARCAAAAPVTGAATSAAAVTPAAAAAPALASAAIPDPVLASAVSSTSHSTPAASASDPAAATWFDDAWCRAEAALKAPAGGAWRDAFDAVSELGEARLRRLAGVLDRVFLGGEMRRQLRLREREEKEGSAEGSRKEDEDWETRREMRRQRRENTEGGGHERSPEGCTGGDAGGKAGKGDDCDRKGGSLGFSVDDDDRGEADW